jgi:hypothetical protein
MVVRHPDDLVVLGQPGRLHGDSVLPKGQHRLHDQWLQLDVSAPLGDDEAHRLGIGEVRDVAAPETLQSFHIGPRVPEGHQLAESAALRPLRHREGAARQRGGGWTMLHQTVPTCTPHSTALWLMAKKRAALMLLRTVHCILCTMQSTIFMLKCTVKHCVACLSWVRGERVGCTARLQ